jgi:hypothetical protein
VDIRASWPGLAPIDEGLGRRQRGRRDQARRDPPVRQSGGERQVEVGDCWLGPRSASLSTSCTAHEPALSAGLLRYLWAVAQDVHPEIRTEQGEKVPADPTRIAAFGSLVARVLGTVDLRSFPLLSGIDPYGYTVFNRIQLPRVVLELRELASRLPDDLRVGVEELALFVSQYADYGWYLWFVGD